MRGEVGWNLPLTFRLLLKASCFFLHSFFTFYPCYPSPCPCLDCLPPCDLSGLPISSLASLQSAKCHCPHPQLCSFRSLTHTHVRPFSDSASSSPPTSNTMSPYAKFCQLRTLCFSSLLPKNLLFRPCTPVLSVLRIFGEFLTVSVPGVTGKCETLNFCLKRQSKFLALPAAEKSLKV